MKHIFHLSTCSSCRRIIKDISPGDDFTMQNIKECSITPQQLDMLAELNGSYSSLFNRQARKYREMELYKQELSDAEIRKLILSEYTFLKRPIFVIGKKIFICKNKENISQLKHLIDQSKQ